MNRVITAPGAVCAAPGSLHAAMSGLAAEESSPPDHTFTRYVFARLVRESRAGDLLQLPPQFYDQLRHFLLQQQQPAHARLLWPLLLRMRQWGAGAAALTLDAEACKVRCQCFRSLSVQRTVARFVFRPHENRLPPTKSRVDCIVSIGTSLSSGIAAATSLLRPYRVVGSGCESGCQAAGNTLHQQHMSAC